MRIYLIAAFVIVLFLAYLAGCERGKHLCQDNIVNHTVIIHDTITHEIVDSFPYYVNELDTIIYSDTVFKDVDTAAILKDYFATHVYNRDWQDSLLQVSLIDKVSRNNFTDSRFTYKILRPQEINYTTIDNSIHYSKYVFLGASLPLSPVKYSGVSNMSYLSLSGLYAFPKGYIELTYQPYTKIITLGSGLRLFKF